jgi:DNA topoisomerase IA
MLQSVGLAMIVRRERERLAFVCAEYHDLKANLTTDLLGSQSLNRALMEL